MTRERTVMSGPTMHSRTDWRLRSPSQRDSSAVARVSIGGEEPDTAGSRTPCFVGNPGIHRSWVVECLHPTHQHPSSNIYISDLLFAISDLSVITKLLRPHDQAFRTIRLHVSVPPLQEVVQDFSTALATHPRADSLHSIALDHLSDSPGGPLRRSEVMEAMHPASS